MSPNKVKSSRTKRTRWWLRSIARVGKQMQQEKTEVHSQMLQSECSGGEIRIRMGINHLIASESHLTRVAAKPMAAIESLGPVKGLRYSQ